MVRQLDEEGNYDQLKVGELRQMLEGIPDDTEVYLRPCHNPAGNIVGAGNLEKSEYYFFGSPIPCVIIEPGFKGYLLDPRQRIKREIDAKT